MSRSKRKSQNDESKEFQKLTVTSYTPGYIPEAKDTVLTKTDTRPGKRWLKWLKRSIVGSLLAILLFIITIGLWDLRNFSSASRTLFGNGSIFSVLQTTPLKTTNNGRVNILLIGYSADDPGHAGATLTDSIQILSLSPEISTGYMLSIPRDLFVRIPDYGQAKINEAYQAGEAADFQEPGFSDGGVGLLQKIINENFGIKTEYYALINYAAVRSTVDALGGITVTIKSSEPEGLYDPNFRPVEGGPLKLANGPQNLDGQTALNLTRARGATYGSYGFPQSDFNRSQHQQLVFAAMKEKLSWKLLLNPRKNGAVFESVATNVKTDIQASEVMPLYRLMKRIPDASLRQINLRDFNGVNLLASYRTPYGQSALIPAAGISNYNQIKAAVTSLNH
jgi:polyisoprenyl-teichoic acid--peptidoglycan teichoic acid transferase